MSNKHQSLNSLPASNPLVGDILGTNWLIHQELSKIVGIAIKTSIGVKMESVEVQAVQCPECKDIIYSRARHDFRKCSCGQCFVDGGFDYLRTGGRCIPVGPRIVNASKKELYDDWNYSNGKYGLILHVD